MTTLPPITLPRPRGFPSSVPRVPRVPGKTVDFHAEEVAGHYRRLVGLLTLPGYLRFTVSRLALAVG